MKGFDFTARVPRLRFPWACRLFLAAVASGLGLHSNCFAQIADPFSQGAVNAINSNLTQEIVLSSNRATMLTGSGTVYMPSSPASMLPQAAGLNGIASPGPNLLIRSANGQNFYTGVTSIPGNAAAVSSTTPSVDGRSMSMAAWNQPYLLPLATGSDAAPAVGAFAPPDWVLVGADGSNPTTWSSALITSAGNTGNVVGRYAYTIYHEGGLLDANVAGYPSTSTISQSAYKSALAYADLTQIGLTAPQVDMIVGWRNYASTQAPGSMSSPGFTAASGSNYYQYVISNTTGFLASGTAVYNGQTDQMFTSRQELINFVESNLGLSGTGLGVLNYLATFTRGLNQPSVSPDPTRPLIASPASNGGNNAEGQESSTEVSNPINPAFPAVLVTGSFTRNDGSTAIVGQPLVNKRFALNRLAWLTYLGPSANRTRYNAGDPSPGINSPDYDMWAMVNLYGISPSYLAQGTAGNIKKYFGLVWQIDNSTNQPGQTVQQGQPTPASSFLDNEYKWFYYPGHVFNSLTGGPISRIVDIANLGTGARDPDFFELLKASLSAGSKAMGSMSLYSIGSQYPTAGSIHPYYYQTLLDTNLDYAIMQLGVNIIDQFKVDGYSTRIVFYDGADPVHEFRGVENLPYIYRLQTGTLKLRMENPQLASGQYLADTIIESGTTVLKDTGVGLLMHIATVWNPHDENAPLGDPAPAGAGLPSTVASGANFRLIADSVEPDGIQAAATATTATGYNYFNANAANNQAINSVTSANSSDYPSAVALSGTLYTTGPLHPGVQISPPMSVTAGPTYSLDPANSSLAFSVPNSTLFREPTPLARAGYPTGSLLSFGVAPLHITQNNAINNMNGTAAYLGLNGFLSDSPNPLYLPTAPPQASQGYVGICVGLYPVEWQVAQSGFGGTLITFADHPSIDVYNGGFGPFLTYRLQYLDPNPADPAGSWETYDEKYTQIDTNYVETAFGSPAVDGGGQYYTGNLSDQADKSPGSDWQSFADPRTSRFSAVNGRNIGNYGQTPGGSGESQEWADSANAVELTDRPDINSGYGIADYRSFADGEFYSLKASTWIVGGTNVTVGNADFFRTGLLEQNSTVALDNGIRFAGDFVAGSGTPTAGATFYQDPDGVVRGAMGNYVGTNGATAPASTTVGLPLATAYPAGYSPVSGNAYQAQSRPYILHRPFRSVAELGYVFSGTPWKNIDLFTPQSGDASLLDVFTINETPANLVAGVVNLNTQQAPVLQALLAGASVDEAQTSGIANTGFAPLTGAQANTLLTTSGTNLLARTASTAPGLGPLQNVSDLVGRWNSALGTGAAGYSGPSADLTSLYSAAFTNTATTMQNVDRFRETFIRPLAAVGNTRVWNLMIDLVVQKGQYNASATNLGNFTVNCEQRYWLHEAIDRYTGQILDQSLETVGPASILLSGSSVTDNLSTNTPVATLSSSELLTGGSFTYALASGTGSNDNAAFTINGNQLQAATVFDSLAKSSYNILLLVTDQNGLTYLQPMTITVKAGPYTQWKVANFGASAGNAAVAGDLVDSQNDGLPNLVKYALGLPPAAPATSGITAQNNGTNLVMNYTRSTAATDVTVTAQETSDLTDPASWTSTGITQTMLSDNGTTQQWQATIPVNSNKQMFMRLMVTRP